MAFKDALDQKFCVRDKDRGQGLLAEPLCLGGACCLPVLASTVSERHYQPKASFGPSHLDGLVTSKQQIACAPAATAALKAPQTIFSAGMQLDNVIPSNPSYNGALPISSLPYSQAELQRSFPVIPRACSGPGCCTPHVDAAESQDGASVSDAEAVAVSGSGGSKAFGTQKGRQKGATKQPSSTSLAQRRYQQRQKDKHKDALQQLDEIKEKVQLLCSEKKDLEAQGRMLQASLDGFHEHLEALSVNEAAQDLQQREALRQLAAVMGRASNQTLPFADVKQWTLEAYVCTHFQTFMQRQAALGRVAMKDPSSPEAAELTSLVEAYRAVCQKTGLSSCLHYGVLAYNMEETQRCKDAAPSPGAWAELLGSLMLTEKQEDELLSAWRLLIKMLTPLSEQRKTLLAQLGVESMSFPWDQMHKAPAATCMQSSFQDEQNAVLGFFITADKILTTAQEATLDSTSYPWCPEWVPMMQSLQRRRGEQAMEVPDMSVRKMSHCPLLPQVTAVDSLVRPMTCKGIGMRLRHGLIMYPFEVALQQPCFPPASGQELQSMTLYTLMMCEWLEEPCWRWAARVKAADRILPNKLKASRQP